jgi:hypothetical protein
MADQRDAARERARDVLQQRAAAAAARAAASAAPAAVVTEPAPPPEPAPEEQAEQSAPALESPSPMPVPDPPEEDTEGSYTLTGTAESDDDGDPGSDTITSSEGVGYAVDLKFPEPPPDGTESGPLDTEEPVAEDPVPEEPEREEPLPPPAVLPTPAEQPPVATSADTPTSPRVDPAVPPQAADDGPILPTPARPTFPRELRPDPMRERLEAAADNIQLPGQSGAGLAAEVPQGVAPGKRAGTAADDPGQSSEAPPLDVFAARLAAKQAVETGSSASGTPMSNADSVRSRYAVESERLSSAIANEASGSPSEMTVPAPLRPGFRAGQSAGDIRPQSHVEPGSALPRPDMAVIEATDALEPEVEDWALHRTRLSLIDSPIFTAQDDLAPSHETPDLIEVPLAADD